MKALKTYVIMLSQSFPGTHPRKGEPTYFEEKVFRATYKQFSTVDVIKDEWIKPEERHKFEPAKLHTIRANYALWRKRFDEVEKGEACISLRKWTGKPYTSKQEEIANLTAKDGIGLQKMEFLHPDDGYTEDAFVWIAGKVLRYDERERLAKNDGLSLQDWEDWFAGYDKKKAFAIIHFTAFRY